MKTFVTSLLCKLIADQRGQILPWVGFLAVGMFGLGGLSVDFGRAYVAKAQLQSYANSAALAAAGQLYTSSTAVTTYADNYSGSSGDKNANSSLGTVTTTVTRMCVNMLLASGTCSSSSTANAVMVTQSTTIPTTFMKLFGKNSLTISTSALASMETSPSPENVAVVLDATQSMTTGSVDSTSCPNMSTNFDCALNGVKTMLSNASTGTVRFALFSFPNVSTSTVSDDWTCSGTPTNEKYTFPAKNLTATTGYEPLTYATNPNTATTYEDTPTAGQFASQDGDAYGFVSDYYSSTGTNNLNSSSSIVKAVNGCMKNPGGEGTYYAGVIYAAQAALLAEQQANPGSKNAMIILSDGQANQGSNLASGNPTGTYAADGVGTSSASSSTGWYPSTTDQCQQAILAAQAAQNAGTTVYAVAFGSESSGCGDGGTVVDTTSIADYTGTSSSITVSSLTPCVTMKNIASGTDEFYADHSSSNNGCSDSAHSLSNISDIFSSVLYSITGLPRLLPTNASGVVVTN